MIAVIVQLRHIWIELFLVRLSGCGLSAAWRWCRDLTGAQELCLLLVELIILDLDWQSVLDLVASVQGKVFCDFRLVCVK